MYEDEEAVCNNSNCEYSEDYICDGTRTNCLRWTTWRYLRRVYSRDSRRKTREKGIKMRFYKNKTYCKYYKSCKVQVCDKSLTLDVIDKAQTLGLHVLQFSEKPDCFCVEY